ncbi:MAG TPA: DUF2726 domain-containing protein [Pyrinomonadaceae bacterium]|nr:DUF2726 domain-containing protein [Pyrinomonadaceae bacterium]
MLTSLFKDDEGAGNERIHYSWLRADFPESEYIVYPNVALQVIIDSEYPAVKEELYEGTEWIEAWDIQWSPWNFFQNSSVDLCVIRKSDYLAQVAFEIDGGSHSSIGRRKKDELKTLLFNRAGIPLVRLRVYRDQSDTSKWLNLEEEIERLSGGPQGVAELLIDTRGRKVICADNVKEYFELLNRVFSPDEYVVLPNVALQSIFTSEVRMAEYSDRDCRQRGLVDFCVFGKEDLCPVIAFTVSEDWVRQRVFRFFGLPLLDLPFCLEGGIAVSSQEAISRIQRRAVEALRSSK